LAEIDFKFGCRDRGGGSWSFVLGFSKSFVRMGREEDPFAKRDLLASSPDKDRMSLGEDSRLVMNITNYGI